LFVFILYFLFVVPMLSGGLNLGFPLGGFVGWRCFINLFPFRLWLY